MKKLIIFWMKKFICDWQYLSENFSVLQPALYRWWAVPLALSCCPSAFCTSPLPYFHSLHKNLHFGENFMKIRQKIKKFLMFTCLLYVPSSLRQLMWHALSFVTSLWYFIHEMMLSFLPDRAKVPELPSTPLPINPSWSTAFVIICLVFKYLI